MGVGAFFKKTVPYLATAAEVFGGPAGSIAASILTKVTGGTVKSPDISGVMQNLSTTEEGRVKLDAAEKEYAETMAKMGYDSVEKLEEVAAADRASARAREVAVKDRMPGMLAIGVTLGFFGTLSLMFFHSIPDAGHDVLLVMIGALGTAWTSVVAYYFGSSAGSAAKTQILAQQGKVGIL